MVDVTERSANWRLFGGGGLLVAGVILLVSAILPFAGQGLAAVWALAIGLIIFGAALFFVAFGETGSNGAVGNSALGKIALVLAGLSAVVLGILWIVAVAIGGLSVPDFLLPLLSIVLALGLLIAAAVIYNKGVAKGIAKWALFVVALVAIFDVIDTFTDIDGTTLWISIAFGVVTLLTGVFYLFNKLNVKAG